MTNVAAALRLIPNRPPDQIAFVVDDLATAITKWSLVLGRNDWRIYTYGPTTVQDLRFRGQPADCSMRLAICGEGPQVELIENLHGENIYTEWSRQHGRGAQHIGYVVPSITETTTRFAELGFNTIQSGRGYGLDGDGGFAYYDIPGIDVTLEFIEIPQRRRPSETLPIAATY
jgi:methylmalonyl-CoA/ethylmalonyl-CoA epimerase